MPQGDGRHEERSEPGGGHDGAAGEGGHGAAADSGLRLDHALKLAGLAPTGGMAKRLIQAGEVLVNGQVETRRKRTLRPGDVIEVAGETFEIDVEAP